MINLKNITIKNFLSIGNVTQAVNLENKDLTLVIGENNDVGDPDASKNGVGKSSLLNAISYALYGAPVVKIKKKNLINNINGKHMVVTLSFTIGTTEYRVERGHGPNFLKLYVNGQESTTEETDESQGDSRRTQDEIVDILGMTHLMFKNIVALNTYSEPFLAMRANDQREVIEQLLGITILTEKAEKLKEEIRKTKDLIKEETLKIDAIKKSNEKIITSIDQLKSRQRAWRSKKSSDIEKMEKALSELEEIDITRELEAHEELAKWSEVNSQISALQKELSALEPAYHRATKSIEKTKKDIEQLDDAECYTCGQKLHDDKRTEIEERKKKELSDNEKYLAEVGDKILEITDALNEIGDHGSKPNTFYETQKEAYAHQSNVNSIQQALQSKKDEEDPYEQQINDLEVTALQEVDWEPVNQLNNFLEHQDFLLKLLTNKDSFVRKKIIDQNLAYLNTRLTQYLSKLGLPHQVTFQNDLSVEIMQLGKDLDFDNLSRGERNRLILGLSFAFRDVWESLYQGINLLFIDELIDSGMDTAGVENSLHVLKQMCRERKKNVYLISHRDELVGRVDNTLKVVKENGFTTFVDEMEE